MNKRRDALRRGVRALILDTSRELAHLEGRQHAPESAAPGSSAETPVPPAAPLAEGGAAEKGVRAPELVRPSGPLGGAVPGGEAGAEDTRRLSDGIRADETRAGRSSPVPSVETTPRSVVAEAHVEGPPGRERQAPVSASHASSAVSTVPVAARPAGGTAPWGSPSEGSSAGHVVPAGPPAAVGLRARPPEPGTPAQRPTPARPARDGRAARDGRPAKAARPPKAGPRSKAAHPLRRPSSPIREVRRARRRALPDIPVDGVDPQQAFSRTGVCFAYFMNNKCWRIRDAYCNTALHMCLIRNCPVYHLHQDALERRFAQKFQHFW